MAAKKDRFGWVGKAQKKLNADLAYRRLGSVDFKLGLVSGDDAKLVTFEAFEIADVQDMPINDQRDADLVIEMSNRDWTNYLKKRAKGNGPSLLSLDLTKDGGVVRASDPLKRVLFERYNLSIQAFIDQGAKLAA